MTSFRLSVSSAIFCASVRRRARRARVGDPDGVAPIAADERGVAPGDSAGDALNGELFDERNMTAVVVTTLSFVNGADATAVLVDDAGTDATASVGKLSVERSTESKSSRFGTTVGDDGSEFAAEPATIEEVDEEVEEDDDEEAAAEGVDLVFEPLPPSSAVGPAAGPIFFVDGMRNF